MEFYFSAISLRISASFEWYPHCVISGHMKISNFQNFWKNFFENKKKFWPLGLSFFRFQFNAKKRFVISHTVRLWWKVNSIILTPDILAQLHESDNFLEILDELCVRFETKYDILTIKEKSLVNLYQVLVRLQTFPGFYFNTVHATL